MFAPLAVERQTVSPSNLVGIKIPRGKIRA